MQTWIPRLILIICLYILSGQILSQEYLIPEPYYVKDIFASDIDLDGDSDLVIGSENDDKLPDSIFIFYNDGLGNLLIDAIQRTNRIFITCGRVDEDSYEDLITMGGIGIIYIKNNGDGTFGEEISIDPPENYKIIEYILDMDEDGLNDLIYTYSNMYTKWGILKNDGDLEFTDNVIFDNGIGGSLYPWVGNLNNDYLPDVCLSFLQQTTHFLINQGNMTFDTNLLCPMSWNTTPIMKLNNIEPDDIAVFHNSSDELFLFENLNNEEFICKDTLPLIGPVKVTGIADYNNDGFDDYCYSLCYWTGCTDSLYICLNNQQWGFSKPQQYYVAEMQFFNTESVDLNCDGFKDIVLYGYYPLYAFKILWNNGFGGFSYENPVGIKEKNNNDNSWEVKFGPNPFGSHIRISLESKSNSCCNVSIVDLIGRPVRDFEISLTQAGEEFEFEWDSKDYSGNKVPSGVYYLTIFQHNKDYQTFKILKY